jgi:hypothetical protein
MTSPLRVVTDNIPIIVAFLLNASFVFLNKQILVYANENQELKVQVHLLTHSRMMLLKRGEAITNLVNGLA